MKKKNKFAGLLKFWDGMQKVICGHERHPGKPKVKDKERSQGQGEANSTVRPEIHISGSEDHHRSRRSVDSMRESLSESFDFGKLYKILYPGRRDFGPWILGKGGGRNIVPE